MKPYRKKFGSVLLRFDGEKHRAQFRDPETGRYVRLVLPVQDEKQADLACSKLATDLAKGSGYLPEKKREEPGISVHDALDESIRLTEGNDVTLARYHRGADEFLAFLRENYRHIETWDQMKPSMFLEWIRSMKKRQLARDTIRLAAVPVRRASAHWAADTPERYRDFAKAARVKLGQPVDKVIPALTAKQLESLLEWLKVNTPALWPMAALQGMAGLRMLEAAYLRHCDVDFEGATVTVTETPLHKPKTESSYRTIPVHPRVIEVLREYLDGRTVKDLSEDAPICLHSKNQPWTLNGLLWAWQSALKGTKADITAIQPTETDTKQDKGHSGARKELGLPGAFTPHNLRATFATLCRKGRCDHPALQAYLGHKAKDVLGQHYDATLKDTDYLRGEVVKAFAVATGQNQAEESRDSRPRNCTQIASAKAATA